MISPGLTYKARRTSIGNITAGRADNEAEGRIGRGIGLEPGQPAYRILIVEDKEESRCLLRKLLEKAGFDVREAVNGKEGVDVFETIGRFLDIRYVYDDEPEDNRIRHTDPVPADLDALPEKWVADFAESVTMGNREDILEHIDQLRPGHSDIADSLAKLVHNYRFDKLFSLLADKLKEDTV